MTPLATDNRSRFQVQLDARRQWQAGSERARKAADARNLEIIHNDLRLQRILNHYCSLDEAGREAMAALVCGGEVAE